MTERRRWPRRPVAWSVRFLIGEGTAIAARALDASRHGLRLTLDRPAGAPELTHGQKCAVEVHLADSQARFFRDAEVCRVDEHGVGLAIPMPLPAALVPAPAPDSEPGAAKRGRRGSIVSRVRAFTLAVCRLGL